MFAFGRVAVRWEDNVDHTMVFIKDCRQTSYVHKETFGTAAESVNLLCSTLSRHMCILTVFYFPVTFLLASLIIA